MPVNFSDVIAAMDAETREAYENHTHNLRDALRKEREAKEGFEVELKTLKSSHATLTTQLETVTKEKGEFETKFNDLSAEVEKTKQKAADKLVEDAIVAAAKEAKFEKPEDAILFVSVASIKRDEKGELIGIKGAIEAVVKDHPYVVKVEPGTPSHGSTNTPETIKIDTDSIPSL